MYIIWKHLPYEIKHLIVSFLCISDKIIFYNSDPKNKYNIFKHSNGIFSYWTTIIKAGDVIKNRNMMRYSKLTNIHLGLVESKLIRLIRLSIYKFDYKTFMFLFDNVIKKPLFYELLTMIICYYEKPKNDFEINSQLKIIKYLLVNIDTEFTDDLYKIIYRLLFYHINAFSLPLLDYLIKSFQIDVNKHFIGVPLWFRVIGMHINIITNRILKNDTEQIKIFFKNGADINAIDCKGDDVFCWVGRIKNKEIRDIFYIELNNY